MGAIVSNEYRESVDKLIASPVIMQMVLGLEGVPDEKLAHDDGGPRFEFMQAANRQYAKMGGDPALPLAIGSVAQALLKVRKILADAKGV